MEYIQIKALFVPQWGNKKKTDSVPSNNIQHSSTFQIRQSQNSNESPLTWTLKQALHSRLWSVSDMCQTQRLCHAVCNININCNIMQSNLLCILL